MSQRLPENASNWLADLSRVTIMQATRNPPRDPNDDEDDEEEEDDDEPGDDEPAVIREHDEDE
jgi:hypothetical protein